VAQSAVALTQFGVNLFKQGTQLLAKHTTGENIQDTRLEKFRPTVSQKYIGGIIEGGFEGDLVGGEYKGREDAWKEVQRVGLPQTAGQLTFEFGGIKIPKIVRPIKFESLQAVMKTKDAIKTDNIQTIISGLTFRGKPLISKQQGKLGLGYKPEKIPYAKIQTGDLIKGERGAGELAKGSKLQSEVFFSDKALDYQVRAGIISLESAKRVKTVKAFTKESLKHKAKVGGLGVLPFKGLTQGQADYITTFTKGLQKDKRVLEIHGSTSTRAHTQAFHKEAGSTLQMHDIDVTPAIPKGAFNILKRKPAQTESQVGEQIIKDFSSGFPLQQGQKINITGKGKGGNLGIELTKGKSKTKVFEVVVEQDPLTAKYGLANIDRVLGRKIPKKVVKTKEGLKVSHQDFQFLTNIKQVLSLQETKGVSTIISNVRQTKYYKTSTADLRSESSIAKERLDPLRYALAESASSRGHYVGGTTAVELQLPKGSFRKGIDVDIYIKPKGNTALENLAVKSEGEKLIKVTQATDKKLGIERAVLPFGLM